MYNVNRGTDIPDYIPLGQTVHDKMDSTYMYISGRSIQVHHQMRSTPSADDIQDI